MNHEFELSILKQLLEFSHTNRNEHLFWCEECKEKHHKPKLSINLEKNKYKCWVCNFHGNNVYDLVRKYGNKQQRRQWPKHFVYNQNTTESQQPITLPECFVSLWDKTDTEHPEIKAAYDYITSGRLVPLEDYEITKYGIGCCIDGLYKGRIIIPSYDFEGKLNYFVARAFEKRTYPKYKNPPCPKSMIFNEYMIDWQQPITLVEGFFDIKDDSCIPLLGSTLSEDSRLFQKIVSKNLDVYVALDQNAFKKMLTIVKNLLEYGVNVFVVDTRGFADVGVMTKTEFAVRKKEAELIDWINFRQLCLVG